MHTKKFSVHVQLKLHQTLNKKPLFKVLMNNQPIDMTDRCNIDTSAVFGENVLSIEFTNKDIRDTKIDNSLKIIEDLAIEIEKCIIDGIDLTHHIKLQGIYKTSRGHENTFGFLHDNGIFTYKFVCPIFYYVRNSSILN